MYKNRLNESILLFDEFPQSNCRLVEQVKINEDKRANTIARQINYTRWSFRGSTRVISIL